MHGGDVGMGDSYGDSYRQHYQQPVAALLPYGHGHGQASVTRQRNNNNKPPVAASFIGNGHHSGGGSRDRQMASFPGHGKLITLFISFTFFSLLFDSLCRIPSYKRLSTEAH